MAAQTRQQIFAEVAKLSWREQKVFQAMLQYEGKMEPPFTLQELYKELTSKRGQSVISQTTWLNPQQQAVLILEIF